MNNQSSKMKIILIMTKLITNQKMNLHFKRTHRQLKPQTNLSKRPQLNKRWKKVLLKVKQMRRVVLMTPKMPTKRNVQKSKAFIAIQNNWNQRATILLEVLVKQSQLKRILRRR